MKPLLSPPVLPLFTLPLLLTKLLLRLLRPSLLSLLLLSCPFPKSEEGVAGGGLPGPVPLDRARAAGRLSCWGREQWEAYPGVSRDCQEGIHMQDRT